MRITVKVFEMPGVKLQTFYEVRTEDSNALHVLGKVSLCFMNAETRRPCRAPESFLDRIRANIS